MIRWLPLVALAAACASTRVESGEAIQQRAREIHARVLTIDTHDDIPFNYATSEVNACGPTRMQVDVPKMIAGGLDVAFLIVYVGQGPRTQEGYAKAKQDALTKFNAIHRMTEQLCPQAINLARTADDVERIARSGKRVAAIGIENGYVIGKDLALISEYHGLGARYITLAHGGHNDIADSATPRANEPASEHDGLSAFGEQVVAEMNRVGIMVDVSHISKAAMLDAVRISRAPVIASHSSTRAIADHPRNMDDEQLLALKANGGVMQTVAFAAYVKEQPAERQQAVAALRQKFAITGGQSLRDLPADQRANYDRELAEIEKKWPRATVRDFVDHIDHAVKLIGIDHVGISSDFDGGGGVEGWNNAAESLNVTTELVRRGYTEEQIAKLWGGNLLRVWRQVERTAQRPAQ
jgi:membrane dipeptidase